MEKPNFLQKEQIEPKFEIFKIEDLIKEVYQESNIPTKRFSRVEEGGVFKYFDINDIPSIYSKEKDERIYPLIKINDIIVALSELEKDPYKENNWWIKFLSVDPKYQNKGYARKLLDEMFNYAKNNNLSLENSIYSKEGEKKLKHILEEKIK